MSRPSALPLVDVESYVPAAITVVRRSRGWPGIFLQERRGGPGEVNYVSGLRQHVLYLFLKPLRNEVIAGGVTRTVQYRVGEARFTPAGHPAAFRWSGHVQILMLGLEPWFLERVAAELGGSVTFSADAITGKLAQDHPICALLRQLDQELELPAGASALAEGVARALAVLLLREFGQLPAPRPVEAAPPVAVLRAVELMSRRLTEAVTLEELAEAAGLSPFHFARQFKTATGHPPHDYLIRLRVDRAQDLMRRQGREWTMAAIAVESGFADQSHMARHFKRVLGVTPGEFADAGTGER